MSAADALPPVPTDGAPTLLKRMLLVLTRPAAAFVGLEQDRFGWLLPAALVSLIMILPAQTVLYPQHLAQQREVMQRYVERGVLTEEQAHAVNERVAEQGAGRAAVKVVLQSVLGLVIQIALRYLLPAALLLAGCTFVMEARTRYAGVLAAVAYSSLPAALREIVRTPLRLSKGDLEVFFSPAVLTGTQSVGGYALDLLDLFDLWILALLIVGLATVTGISRGRAAGLVLPLWGILSLLKIGLKASPLGAGL